ncbi:SGNH/GDSL hydrolase family protein [Kistimonas scapharcae]|uniref:SGNH/GDSL hydrolase family protein n=1 Tax=Kistimonas scapharcae TaxID=1036133 RepID=A0ABP8V4K1_9GAMM
MNVVRRSVWRHRLFWWVGLAALPVLAVQGRWVRRKTPRLPEARGEWRGSAGSGSIVRHLYLLGESTVAGVGVDLMRQALAGQLANALSAESRAKVSWQALGKNGLKCEDSISELLPSFRQAQEDAPASLMVIALGVNDTTGLTSQNAWRRQLVHMLEEIRSVTDCPVVFAAIPPVHLFSALPQPLSTVLGARARLLDKVLQNVAKAHSRVFHMNTVFHFQPDYLASDGYHPSEKGYRLWGEQLARQIHAAGLLE